MCQKFIVRVLALIEKVPLVSKCIFLQWGTTYLFCSNFELSWHFEISVSGKIGKMNKMSIWTKPIQPIWVETNPTHWVVHCYRSLRSSQRSTNNSSPVAFHKAVTLRRSWLQLEVLLSLDDIHEAHERLWKGRDFEDKVLREACKLFFSSGTA